MIENLSVEFKELDRFRGTLPESILVSRMMEASLVLTTRMM